MFKIYFLREANDAIVNHSRWSLTFFSAARSNATLRASNGIKKTLIILYQRYGCYEDWYCKFSHKESRILTNCR